MCTHDIDRKYQGFGIKMNIIAVTILHAICYTKVFLVVLIFIFNRIFTLLTEPEMKSDCIHTPQS